MNIIVLLAIMQVILFFFTLNTTPHSSAYSYKHIYNIFQKKGDKHMNGIIEKEAVITQGEYVTATTHAEEFHLTPGQQYKVLGYNGDILVKNDLGKEEYYSLEYFEEYQEMY